jgi:hypothetical protein
MVSPEGRARGPDDDDDDELPIGDPDDDDFDTDDDDDDDEEPLQVQRRADYWMTSSARASSDLGSAMPSAWADFMFTTISNRVGCSMGKSAALAPPRMRVT